ncbi:hypothetical protein BJX70DRAFT_398693 [Aspergillus crustosus]
MPALLQTPARNPPDDLGGSTRWNGYTDYTVPPSTCDPHVWICNPKRDSELQDNVSGGKNGLVSLLVTSKKVYSEAIHLLYSQNTFTFTKFELLAIFRSCIPAEHWELIQSVQVDDLNTLWTYENRIKAFRTLCADARSLKSLRKFKMKFRQWSPSSGYKLFAKELESLRGLPADMQWELAVEGIEEEDRVVVKSVLDAAGMECLVTIVPRGNRRD